jgi:hypothetical protein
LWDGDAAANADAISLHSDLGPGLNLFGRARGVAPGTMRCMLILRPVQTPPLG